MNKRGAALNCPNPRYIALSMQRLALLSRAFASVIPRFLGAFVLALAMLAAAATGQAQEAWFETTELNPGLPPPPETLDRGTPMAALESFIYTSWDNPVTVQQMSPPCVVGYEPCRLACATAPSEEQTLAACGLSFFVFGREPLGQHQQLDDSVVFLILALVLVREVPSLR